MNKLVILSASSILAIVVGYVIKLSLLLMLINFALYLFKNADFYFSLIWIVVIGCLYLFLLTIYMSRLKSKLNETVEKEKEYNYAERIRKLKKARK